MSFQNVEKYSFQVELNIAGYKFLMFKIQLNGRSKQNPIKKGGGGGLKQNI